jgi:hypothetical protein
LLAQGGQLRCWAAGEAWLEDAFRQRAAAAPQSVSVTIGYNEALAHQLFGAGDVTLVPSLFEPCGLTQMYGLKYGSLPLVRRVGGLADTVVDSIAGRPGQRRGHRLRVRPLRRGRTTNARCAAPSPCTSARPTGGACAQRHAAPGRLGDGGRAVHRRLPAVAGAG